MEVGEDAMQRGEVHGGAAVRRANMVTMWDEKRR